MEAVVVHSFDAPLRLEEVPIPESGHSHDVLSKLRWVGLRHGHHPFAR
jgi:D-arabinose 1-dehydrogenase-like Zn-dependent alcohol dehydrogenase